MDALQEVCNVCSGATLCIAKLPALRASLTSRVYIQDAIEKSGWSKKAFLEALRKYFVFVKKNTMIFHDHNVVVRIKLSPSPSLSSYSSPLISCISKDTQNGPPVRSCVCVSSTSRVFPGGEGFVSEIGRFQRSPTKNPRAHCKKIQGVCLVPSNFTTNGANGRKYPKQRCVPSQGSRIFLSRS